MAAPVPPQGNQSPHTERPLKVYAEQYVAGQPLPVGVVADLQPLYLAAGGPYAQLPTAIVPMQAGDWLLSNRYTGRPVEVIGPEEFAERFGPGGA